MRKGFTLLEIAIALIIIGVLAGISIPILTQLNKGKGIEVAKRDLETYKKRIIVFYQTHGRLPRHTANYQLPPDTLQIPLKYTRDPIKGIPYLYYSGPIVFTQADSLYVDGNSIGPAGKSAVIICAGPNGEFDGENTNPADNRFQSTGPGDFDDILIAISERELITGGPVTDTCNSYTVSIRNVSGTTIYVFPTKTRTTYSQINNNGVLSFTNIHPYELILVSTINTFLHTQTNFLVPRKYDINGNCRIAIDVYRVSTTINVPYFSLDLN